MNANCLKCASSDISHNPKIGGKGDKKAAIQSVSTGVLFSKTDTEETD